MPVGDIEPDKQLVERLLHGEEKAFRLFFDEYFARLYRFALRRLDGDEDATKDVVQITMTKAVQKLDTWRGDATLYTWLCQICRNGIADHVRAQKRFRSRLVLVEDDPGARSVVDNTPAPDTDAPASRLELDEVSEVVQTMLDALPNHYGKALELKYIEGLSVEEIGERLEVGATAAQSLLARARTAFRRRLNVMSAEDRAVIGHLI